YGNYAYVGDDGSGLQVIDISDPVNPAFVVSYDTPGAARRIDISGEYIFIADIFSTMILRNTFEGISGDNPVPQNFSLSPSYPNPFNASTAIRYKLPASSDVSLDIFDITGRKIETLTSGHQDAGEHQAVWNASGRASGIYFYRLKAGDVSKTEKCILIK
ncbi:MAG TPA: hypothetical protein DEO84_11735, partial [candidate division Zixibacteria bacterium]|nr:hypothetical protein [candidate division Zixibacteria bacterium]HBZ01978.1 hypothetical protein [candidate division Zixibacteria bacterium]